MNVNVYSLSLFLEIGDRGKVSYRTVWYWIICKWTRKIRSGQCYREFIKQFLKLIDENGELHKSRIKKSGFTSSYLLQLIIQFLKKASQLIFNCVMDDLDQMRG